MRMLRGVLVLHFCVFFRAPVSGFENTHVCDIHMSLYMPSIAASELAGCVDGRFVGTGRRRKLRLTSERWRWTRKLVSCGLVPRHCHCPRPQSRSWRRTRACCSRSWLPSIKRLKPCSPSSHNCRCGRLGRAVGVHEGRTVRGQSCGCAARCHRIICPGWKVRMRSSLTPTRRYRFVRS